MKTRTAIFDAPDSRHPASLDLLEIKHPANRGADGFHRGFTQTGERTLD
jgi:hypothetical protein